MKSISRPLWNLSGRQHWTGGLDGKTGERARIREMYSERDICGTVGVGRVSGATAATATAAAAAAAGWAACAVESPASATAAFHDAAAAAA